MGIEVNNMNVFGVNSSTMYRLPYSGESFGFGDQTNIFGNASLSADPFEALNKNLTSIIMQQNAMLMALFNQNPMNFDLGLPETAPKPEKRFLGLFGGKSRLSRECKKQIEDMASELKMQPKDIIALIQSESSGNPHAVNKSSGATGLIQFMPKTAKSLGTSVDELVNMTAEEQMPYVKKYLTQAKKNAGMSKDAEVNSGTLYSLVFLPAFANKEVLCTSESKYYAQNKGLDKDNDGKITKDELGKRLESYL